MLLNNSQASCNIIQPIPRFYAFRFGRRLKVENYTNDNHPQESKINQVFRKVFEFLHFKRSSRTFGYQRKISMMTPAQILLSLVFEIVIGISMMMTFKI